MLYGFSGLGEEPAQPGWAQMAECLGSGGYWTGTECVQNQGTVAAQACAAAGGQWDATTQKCSVPIVTPGQPPPQEPPKKGLSTTAMVLIAAAVVGAVVLYPRSRR